MEFPLKKYCRFCDMNKPLVDFYTASHCYLGVSNKCKECNNKYGKENYQKNKSEYKKRATRWANDNREKRRLIVHRSDFKYREKKRVLSILYNKKMRSLNIEGERLKGRLSTHKRNARLRKNVSTLSIKQLKSILQSAKKFCVYCGLPTEKLTADHVIPVSCGGGNTKNNIIPCCKSCNSKKWKKEVSDWVFMEYGIEGLCRTIMYLERNDFTRLCKKDTVHSVFNIDIK